MSGVDEDVKLKMWLLTMATTAVVALFAFISVS